MKQIIIRIFVALTTCGVTGIVRFTTFQVISSPWVHAESIWILRLFVASVLSPILYNYLSKVTSSWAIGPKHESYLPRRQWIL
jgi:hypothetical protein